MEMKLCWELATIVFKESGKTYNHSVTENPKICNSSRPASQNSQSDHGILGSKLLEKYPTYKAEGPKDEG